MQADYARAYRTLWDHHWWWRSREAMLLAKIRRLARTAPTRRILDVGCGDGLFFDALARFGEVQGLEPDASLVRDPRWRSRIQVATLGPGFEPEAPFDLLLMLDVLEHIEDDRAALRSASACLQPGGYLLLTVPALPWLWSRHDEANQHHRRYSPRTLREVMAQAGFVVESLRFAFAWTVGPMVVRRWLAPAGPAPGVADYAITIPPDPINRALDLVSRCDHAMGQAIRWPIGSSLVALARRPEGPGRVEPAS